MLIETYADLICPWCYIGRRRLDRALAQRPGVRPEIRWRPFQLNPEMPRGGMDRQHYLAAKFGGIERAGQVCRVVADTALRDGIALRLDRIRRTPNSFDAHRLVCWAGRAGLSEPMADALMKAFFVEGEDIGDWSVLAAMAANLGFDADDAWAMLRTDAESAAVRSSDVTARQMGLQAVPCYVFERRYAIAGAQEPQSFLPLLDLAVGDLMASAAD